MRALDTNVLVRHLSAGDAKQLVTTVELIGEISMDIVTFDRGLKHAAGFTVVG